MPWSLARAAAVEIKHGCFGSKTGPRRSWDAARLQTRKKSPRKADHWSSTWSLTVPPSCTVQSKTLHWARSSSDCDRCSDNLTLLYQSVDRRQWVPYALSELASCSLERTATSSFPKSFCSRLLASSSSFSSSLPCFQDRAERSPAIRADKTREPHSGDGD